MVATRKTTKQGGNHSAAATKEFAHAASAARENLSEMGSAAKEIARNRIEHLTEEVAELRDVVGQKVGEHPLRSVLIAGGVGLLVGLVLRRR